jgi:Flp pilus assembly protein TadG
VSRHAQRGAALVEFAVVAPFMFMVFFAAIEFGWMFYAYQSTDYGARLGARWAAVRGKDCVAATCPVTAAQVQTYVANTVPGLGSSMVTVNWNEPPASYFQQPSGACGQGDQEQGCIVDVKVVDPLHFTIPFVWDGTINLTSESQVAIQ